MDELMSFIFRAHISSRNSKGGNDAKMIQKNKENIITLY